MFLSKEFDEKLKMAFEIYNKKLCDSLPSIEELEHITFSENFEKKMQKLISMQKKSYYYMINTVGKRVAIILLTLLISLTATTFGVKAIRESVIEFITETFEKFTKVTVENNEPIEMHTEFIKTIPEYIPEGYTIEPQIDTFGLYQITYINKENNSIVYMQEFNNSNNFHANTEDIEFEKIFINSYEGMLCFKNGVNKIIFADEIYMYTIYGDIEKEELIKIAESIKIN